MPVRNDPSRPLLASLARLAGRAALVAGSVAMAVRVTVPRVEQSAGRTSDDGENEGRGRHSTPASRASVLAGHETEDMSARTMARVLVSLAGVAVVMVFLMLGFERLIIPPREHRFATLPPQETQHPPPPAPNLQSDPVADLTRLNGTADELLNHYARIDADHARIPIDRAMALTVGRPLDTAP